MTTTLSLATNASQDCKIGAGERFDEGLPLGHGRKPRQHWNGPMYRELTQREIDRIIAEAHARRAGAFARLMSGIFKR